jgi:hypothetical protein
MIPDYHIFVRWCWRSLRKVPMLVYPQRVSIYGALEFGDRGRAVCMGCGREHLILDFKGLQAE